DLRAEAETGQGAQHRPLLVTVAVAVEREDVVRQLAYGPHPREGVEQGRADDVVEGGADDPGRIVRVERAAADLAGRRGEEPFDRGRIGGDLLGHRAEPVG